MMPGLLAVAISFFSFFVVQVVLFNLFTIKRRFQALVGMWFCLSVLYGFLFAIFQHRLPVKWLASTRIETIVSFLNGATLYLLLFLVYCCFYFTDHSLTVAFAIEFDARGSMTRDDLKQRFPYDAMLEQRLADLIANQYVRRDGGAYQLAPKGRCFVAVLGTLKNFLKLEPGG